MLDPNDETEKFWRSAFFAGPQPSILTTKDNRIVHVNEASADFLGIATEDLIGRKISSLLEPLTENKAFEKQMEEIGLGGKHRTVHIEAKILKSDESEAFVEARIVAINEELFLWTLQDVTELKSSDKLLEFFAQTLKSFEMSLNFNDTLNQGARIVVDHLADWCRIDILDGAKLSIAAAAHSQSSLEKYIWQLEGTAASGASVIFCPQRVVRTGDTDFIANVEKFLTLKASEENPQLSMLKSLGLKSYMCVPLRTGDTVTGCLTMGLSDRQFTRIDLVIAEELAAKFGQSLERAAYYRHLEELKNAAEAASVSKTFFLANVSHEIRTPLGAVLGFAELLQNPNESNENRSVWGAKIKLNGERLLRIIDDILDLAKAESGRFEVEKRSIEFKKFLQDLYAVLDQRAQSKNIRLKFFIEGPLPSTIIADDTRLMQVLCNVIGNAVKFTTDGQVTVRIKILDEPVSKLCFVVEDNGPGLTPEQACRLFEPFSQADSSHTRKFGGTGLGLALSRRLAKSMGGDVVLTRSIPGQGSTFTITIDIGNLSELGQKFESLSFKELVPQKEDSLPSLRGLEVLVVEDSPDNQMLVSTYLQSAGAKVTLACNGEEGVAKALERSFHIILMDIQMPVKDGYESTKELREKKYDGPIVALTAHAMKAEQERCLSAGCVGYLTKPVSRKDLITAVAHMASR